MRGLAGALSRRAARWLSMAGALLAAVLAALELLFQVGSVGLGRFTVLMALLLGFGHLALRMVDRATFQRADSPPPSWADSDIARRAAQARGDLMREIAYWVGVELKRGGDITERLQLSLVERPEAVVNARRVGHPDLRTLDLDPDARAKTVFNLLGRQLLVLGEPGSGKTTLLLELARDLLAAAAKETAQPVPVLFTLPAWAADQRPLAAWLADVLSREHGVAPWLAAHWIRSDSVVPMLDGLDEVPASLRDRCAAAINQFHREHGQIPLVVASRVAEYEALPERLHLRGAVAILPLTEANVLRYLRAAPRRHLSGVRAVLANDAELRGLVSTPQLLRMLTLTYQGMPAEAAPAAGSPEERRHRLLEDYVRAVLGHRGSNGAAPPYSDAEVRRWLTWLAARMRERGEPVFYLDRIQPDWLHRPFHRWLASAGVATAAGLATALLGCAVVLLVLRLAATGAPVPVEGLAPRAAIGIAAAGLAGVALALAVYEPEIPRASRWSWPAWRRTLPGNLLLGLACGPVFALAALAFQRSLGLSRLVLALAGAGLLIGLGLGLWQSFMAGFEAPAGPPPRTPGRDIAAMARSGWIGALAGALTVGPGAGLAVSLGLNLVLGTSSLVLSAIAAVVAAMFVALMSGLRLGGAAYWQHRLVCRLLVGDGITPPDLAGFLQYAARLTLLRREGAGYAFVHPLLFQHFAEG